MFFFFGKSQSLNGKSFFTTLLSVSVKELFINDIIFLGEGLDPPRHRKSHFGLPHKATNFPLLVGKLQPNPIVLQKATFCLTPNPPCHAKSIFA